jgi:hypothetical protein
MNIFIISSIILYNSKEKQKMTMIYKKMDFERIQYEGFTYTLSPDVLKIIQSIADQVGAPEYVKTPQFEKRYPPSSTNRLGEPAAVHQNSTSSTNSRQTTNNAPRNNVERNASSDYKKRDKYNYGSTKGQEISDDDWTALRKFQATVLAKKEGIEAAIETIRKHLNKITDKTYETLKVLIVEEINKIISGETEYSTELLVELNKIGDAIFNIASSNGFYSKVYATLYKDLMAQYPFMRGIFIKNYKAFNALFKTIEYCDPNKDYDKFCQVNKDNEKRRSMCSFYINLMLQGIIAPKSIMKIILGLQELLVEKIKLPDAKNIGDELAEVLFILITSSAEMFKEGLDKNEPSAASSSSSDDEEEEEEEESNQNVVISTYVSKEKWEKIVANVNTIAKLKQNAFPSISNKTIFKHMDIIDEAEL